MTTTNKTLTDAQTARLVAKLTARLAREGRQDLADALLATARDRLSK